MDGENGTAVVERTKRRDGGELLENIEYSKYTKKEQNIMAIFGRKKPTLEEILSMIDGLPEEDKTKLTEHLTERHDEEEKAYEEKEQGEELEEKGEVEKGEEEVEQADEAHEEATEDAEKAEDEAEADKEYAEEEKHDEEDTESVDEREAVFKAYEERIAKLEETVARMAERLEDKEFGAMGTANPTTDNGEWVGRHTKAYFGR